MNTNLYCRLYSKNMTMKKHFMTTSDGSLWDMRIKPLGKLVRENYTGHHRDITSNRELLATLRAGRFTDWGSYPLFFITADGAALSFDSVKENLREIIGAMRSNNRSGGWYIIACEVNYEDADLYCAHSGERIESAYAEDSEGE
jgi:hypothetical protein